MMRSQTVSTSLALQRLQGSTDALEDTGIEIPAFRNKIFAMFIAPPKPGDETNDASKGTPSGFSSCTGLTEFYYKLAQKMRF
jgi:hypothetical protein